MDKKLFTETTITNTVKALGFDHATYVVDAEGNEDVWVYKAQYTDENLSNVKFIDVTGDTNEEMLKDVVKAL